MQRGDAGAQRARVARGGAYFGSIRDRSAVARSVQFAEPRRRWRPFRRGDPVNLRPFSVALLLPAFAVACAVQPASSTDSAPAPAAPSVAPSDLQPQVDALARSIATHDVAAFDGLASKELAARVEERGAGSAAFLEKLGASLRVTFALGEGEVPAFEVADAVAEGEAVKVTLRLHGEELKKPFYFVREDGALKLNLAPRASTNRRPRGRSSARTTTRSTTSTPAAWRR
jgi:hypothetical protein